MRDLTARVLDNLLEVKDAFDLRHIDRAVHPGQPRSEPVHHGATGQEIRAGLRHGHRRQDLAHRHHGAVAGHSRRGRPARPSARNWRAAITRCSTATTAPSSSIRPTRRCLNTASWPKSRRRWRKNCAKSSASPPSRSTANPSISPRTSKTRTTSKPSSRTARKASACSARNFCSSTATACRPRRSNIRSTARSPPR